MLFEKIVFLTVQDVVDGQRKKLYNCAKELIPNITSDDLLQPNDFPELENNPLFRYEEGVLEGLLTLQTTLLSLYKESKEENKE